MADLMTLRRNIIASKAEKPVAKVYGVEWNYADPSTVLKRTGAAANFANPIPATSLSETGWSPFDNLYPWSEMKRYNIINGEVAYSEDDAGYSETLYDTMVYIPEFYYYAYKDTANQKWYWSISDTSLDGYKKHPGSGRYVGRFHTSGSSSGVFSKSGTTPLANATSAAFRTYSRNKGISWEQLDIKTWSAIQILYLIEYADWNSQSVLGMGLNNGSKSNGSTTGALFHTIKRGTYSNMYRWIENPFSCIRNYVDGIAASTTSIYITTDRTKYNTTIANQLDSTEFVLPGTAYWIGGFGYDSKYSWAFIPDSGGGTSATKITDSIDYGGKENNFLSVGGYSGVANNFGMFYFNISNITSSSGKDNGSRLIFIPTT